MAQPPLCCVNTFNTGNNSFIMERRYRTIGGAFALGTCITIGLTAIGLMGYSNSIARDREKGVFQRLRATPIPSWCIMTSRITVQLVLIAIVTLLVFFAGFYFDKISFRACWIHFSFYCCDNWRRRLSWFGADDCWLNKKS